MTPRFTTGDPRIDAVRGCVAVERGPLVYCAESPAADLDTLTVDATRAPVQDGTDVLVTARFRPAADEPWPYTAATADDPGPAVPIRLLPYHRWARRGPATMRVWLPVTTENR
jgi:DUF1680 family protein